MSSKTTPSSSVENPKFPECQERSGNDGGGLPEPGRSRPKGWWFHSQTPVRNTPVLFVEKTKVPCGDRLGRKRTRSDLDEQVSKLFGAYGFSCLKDSRRTPPSVTTRSETVRVRESPENREVVPVSEQEKPTPESCEKIPEVPEWGSRQATISGQSHGVGSGVQVGLGWGAL